MRPRFDQRGYTLIDLMVAGVILAVVLAIVGDYLFSANNTVARSAAHQDDNAAAQTAMLLIENNVRFACDMSISGGILYVQSSCGGPPPACSTWSGTEWSEGGDHLIQSTSGASSAVANGISGLSFTANSSYTGLVTVQFKLNQPQDQSWDPGGVAVNQTLTARDMTGPVGSTALCT